MSTRLRRAPAREGRHRARMSRGITAAPQSPSLCVLRVSVPPLVKTTSAVMLDTKKI